MTGDCGEDDPARVDDNGEERPAAGDVGVGPLLNLQRALQVDYSFRGSLKIVRLKSASGGDEGPDVSGRIRCHRSAGSDGRRQREG
jgi:hypothetical protein